MVDSSLPRRPLLILAGSALLAPGVSYADSLYQFDRKLEGQEPFFQLMDRPAPGFTLQGDNGRTVGLKDLRGKLVVLNFIYTRCPDICPLQTERMALLQRMLKPTALRDEVRLVSVTADPVNDTPDVMKAYGEQHGLDPATWLFLTSGPSRPDETRRLAQKGYHNRYQVEPDGSITHGTVFHVIDSEGIWRGNFHGLDWKPEHLVMFLTELAHRAQGTAQQTAPSLWQRIKDLL